MERFEREPGTLKHEWGNAAAAWPAMGAREAPRGLDDLGEAGW